MVIVPLHSNTTWRLEVCQGPADEEQQDVVSNDSYLNIIE